MKNISDNTILDKTIIDKQDGKVRIFFAIKLLFKRITIKNSKIIKIIELNIRETVVRNTISYIKIINLNLLIYIYTPFILITFS